MNRKKLLTLVGAILGIVALGLSIVTMVLQKDPFPAIIAVSGAALVVALLGGFLSKVDFLAAFAPCLYVLAALLLLVTQFTNIGYALYNVNIGDGIMPSFVIGFVLFLAAGIVQAMASFAKTNA